MEITKKQILTKGLNTSQIIEEQSKKSGGKKLVDMALGGYYTEIGEKLDGLIESYQGKYEIVKGYKSYSFEDYKNVEQLIKYFNGLADMVETKRDCCKDSYLQNQIDTILELIYSTLYKLKNLK